MSICCRAFGVLLVLLSTSQARADIKNGIPAPPAPFTKAAPETVDELRAIQDHVKLVVNRVMSATVGVRIGAGSGSGVIVNAEGLVLTAAHVSGPAGRDVTVILHDGTQAKGKTLGANQTIDSGMIQIVSPVKRWDYIEMGNSADVRKGDWCIAMGHPGGYRTGRTPVVRLGRIQEINRSAIRTDCTLVGGDSGGPLFDMNGYVIGIHSRIGTQITANIHVPVDTYRDTWDRLAASEVWGSGIGGKKPPTIPKPLPAKDAPFLGVQADPDADACKIAQVVANSPAAKAGLQADDVITRLDTERIESFEDLVQNVARHRPGDRVTLLVQRGGQRLNIEVVLGKRDS